MRRLPQRGAISTDAAVAEAVTTRLAVETQAIVAHGHPKAEAERRYSNARQTKWFEPVVERLQGLSGPGQRCMYCSGSEASDVEHYRPKAVYPERALTWENFLWICGICNRRKGDAFPPAEDGRPLLLDPLVDDVWAHAYLDEFGQLVPRWDLEREDFDPRAQTTITRCGLDRQALQESRQARLHELADFARDQCALLDAGRTTATGVRARLAIMMANPAQPDVADYFLRGPGRVEGDFARLFARLEEAEVVAAGE